MTRTSMRGARNAVGLRHYRDRNGFGGLLGRICAGSQGYLVSYSASYGAAPITVLTRKRDAPAVRLNRQAKEA
jgi:hypothetical protein